MSPRSYCKINYAALPKLYNNICNNIPIYEIIDGRMLDDQPLLRESTGTISAAYYRYRRVIEIECPISIFDHGKEILKKRFRLFHKSIRPYRCNGEVDRGYITTHIIIKRMYPLLGKVKESNFRG